MTLKRWLAATLLVTASGSSFAAGYSINECLLNAHGQTYTEQLFSAVECFNTIGSPYARKIAQCVQDASGDSLRLTTGIIQYCMLEGKDPVMLDVITCVRTGRGTTQMQKIDSSRWCLSKLPI